MVLCEDLHAEKQVAVRVVDLGGVRQRWVRMEVQERQSVRYHQHPEGISHGHGYDGVDWGS